MSKSKLDTLCKKPESGSFYLYSEPDSGFLCRLPSSCLNAHFQPMKMLKICSQPIRSQNLVKSKFLSRFKKEMIEVSRTTNRLVKSYSSLLTEIQTIRKQIEAENEEIILDRFTVWLSICPFIRIIIFCDSFLFFWLFFGLCIFLLDLWRFGEG